MVSRTQIICFMNELYLYKFCGYRSHETWEFVTRAELEMSVFIES